MKQVLVIGKTDVTINLNKIGVPIRGRVKALLNVSTEEHMNEIYGLTRAGLIDILSMESNDPVKVDSQIKPPVVIIKDDKDSEKTPDIKTSDTKKAGRPKGSKNKTKDIQNPIKINLLAEEEGKRVSDAEAKTQNLRSRVVIGTLDGPKQGHMAHNAIDNIPESEKTQASIEAMEKLEKEENEDVILPDFAIDDSKLDASEQNGRKAIISTQSGVENVEMVNSILPEANASRNINPFIDRKVDIAKDTKDTKDIKEGDGDDFSDAFIQL